MLRLIDVTAESPLSCIHLHVPSSLVLFTLEMLSVVDRDVTSCVILPLPLRYTNESQIGGPVDGGCRQDPTVLFESGCSSCSNITRSVMTVELVHMICTGNPSVTGPLVDNVRASVTRSK
jgi:hypothetical protein